MQSNATGVRRARRASGFTLVELTVVLMVLAALAGILIPMLSGYVERSHAAAASTNIGEINKFVQLYQTKYLRGWGTGFDSLVDATNTAENELYGALSDELTGSGSPVSVTALTAVQADSLIAGGITTLADMTPVADLTAGANATYDANNPATFTAVATAVDVVFLSDAQVQAQFGLSVAQTNTEDYVLFGLGQRSSLVGKVMTEAPLHFDQADPKLAYSRFFLVFAVPEETVTGEGFKARFVGALGAEANGLGDHLGTYFSKDAE